MMKHIARKDSQTFHPGTVIIGKWQQTRYTIVKQIGMGMIGTVYLCKAKGRLVALKMSTQQMQMTTEVNVLKMLNEVQDSHLGPLLYEVDDWMAPNRLMYSFYVMEYIPGMPIDMYMKDKGPEWFVVLLVQLLDELEKVHRAGWVFGDLKKEHILIQEGPLLVRCIDVGGMTKRGRSIKEYSAFYDRAYWQLGSRTSEPSYDLFAVVMIVLATYYPQQFKRSTTSLQALTSKVKGIGPLHMIHPVLIAALRGEFLTAKAMKAEIIRVTVKRRMKRKERQRYSTSYLMQSFLIGSVATLFYVLSLYL